MLGGYWLLITVVLLLLAGLLKQTPLLLIALLFFLTSGTARLWARYSLARLTYSRRLGSPKVFWGDTVTLDITVANEKMLPLPWVHVEEELPMELDALAGTVDVGAKAGRNALTTTLSLGWYHRRSRRYPMRCLNRGVFSFGPTLIQSGDLFGFFRNETVVQTTDRLIVYPPIVPLEQLGIPSRDPFGDLRVRRHLFEDPVRVAATRDYMPGDPLRRIHWKSSARMARLQTRTFDHTTSIDMVLFLDTRTMQVAHLGRVHQLLEMAVITASSIANHASSNGYRVGLLANEPMHNDNRFIRLPPSQHPDQLQHMLELLAHIRGFPFLSMPQLLEREARILSGDATLVVITAVPDEPLVSSIHRYRRAGRRVALVVIGGEAPPQDGTGMPTYHVSDEVPWRDLESIRLQAAQATGATHGTSLSDGAVRA